MAEKYMNGPWVSHWSSGQVDYKINNKHGKYHGLFESYFWDGALWWKGEFKNHKERGLWYEYEYTK